MSAATAPWKLVYFHHPPYSPGGHGSQEFMQWPFEEWGADAVLAGHDHLYARVLKNEPDAIPYFICGLSGRTNIYDCDQPLSADEFDAICYNEKNGAMKITATPEDILFEFFVEGEESEVDSYMLEK